MTDEQVYATLAAIWAATFGVYFAIGCALGRLLYAPSAQMPSQPTPNPERRG